MLTQQDDQSLKKFRQQMVIEKNLSKNTINAYIVDIKQFLLFPSHESDVSKKAAQYMESLQEQKLKVNSILRKFAAIRQYYQFLDIHLSVRLPKQRTVTQITNHQDIRKLIHSCENLKEKAFMQLLFATGGRISEIISLKVQQLHSCIYGTQQHFMLTGKGKKERVVFVNEQAKIAIYDYLQTRTDENIFLFPARLSVNHITRQWGFKVIQKAAKKLNLDNIHPHSFRHAKAMFLLDSNIDLVAIQKILGHAHLSTTERYLKLHWQHLMDGMSKHPLSKTHK